ncbi:DoxX family protein [Nitriliruptoraceae bacterium ZYF776]|nr:DoxX family protein [Profundirhabdus halotolerans]
MAAHGWDKLQGGVDGFAEGALAGLGVPAPLVVAWLVTVVELGGGIALVLGVLTRLAAAANALVLVGAIALVKVDVGLIAEEGAGAELDLALLAGLVAVLLLGPGRPSVDHAVGVEEAVPELAARR